MEFFDYARLLQRRWVSITVLTLVGGLAGVVSALVATPTYRATAEMFVGTDLRKQLDLSASQYTLDRMQSYAALVRSSQVTGGVRQRLDLTSSPAEIGDQISASVIPGTVLIQLEVEDTDAARTARIANAAAEGLAKAITDLEASEQAVSPLKVTITLPASVPSFPVSPNRTLRLGTGIALGLGAGLLLASLRDQAARSRLAAAVAPADAPPAPVPGPSAAPVAEPVDARPVTDPPADRDREDGRPAAWARDGSAPAERAPDPWAELDRPVTDGGTSRAVVTSDGRTVIFGDDDATEAWWYTAEQRPASPPVS